MRQEIITSLICSGCVGLATLAGTVLINQTKIENLNTTITELKNDIKILEGSTSNLGEELSRFEGILLSVNKLNSLTPQEKNRLESGIRSNDFQLNSDLYGATSEELLSNDSLSPDLKSLIREHQLTGDDLKSYSLLLEAEIE